MHAYAETYLARAMKNLGEAFDYAINACGIGADEFAARFKASGLAGEWEDGSARVLAGLSGIEVVREAYRLTGSERKWPEPKKTFELSVEYWAGWVLAYYQWWSARSFDEIFMKVSFDEVVGMYPVMHEASEARFVDRMEEGFAGSGSRLKMWRERKGFSQSELERASGVKIRNIRLYEQHPESIAKAEYRTVKMLAKVLGCCVDNLVQLPVEETQ